MKQKNTWIDPDWVIGSRVSSGLTQYQFAKKLGVSTVLISMVETGLKPVTLKLLGQIATVFKQEFVITIKP